MTNANIEVDLGFCSRCGVVQVLRGPDRYCNQPRCPAGTIRDLYASTRADGTVIFFKVDVGCVACFAAHNHNLKCDCICHTKKDQTQEGK